MFKNFPKLDNAYNPDIDVAIPHDVFSAESFFKKLKRLFRLYRRFSTLFFSSQAGLIHDKFPPAVKNILWINLAGTSIGDTIMELSSRVLLADTDFRLDLLTNVKNASLFEDDDIFQNIYVEPNIEVKYDLIILDIFNTKSIRIKAKYFKHVPMVTLRGYWMSTYFGADYNRVLFSFHRLNKLLGHKFSDTYIDSIANNYLVKCTYNQKNKYVISIAIGGEDVIRTYQHWPAVIHELLQRYNDLTINLIGSNNGIEDSLAIATHFPEVNNYVGKLNLIQTREIVAQSNFFLGADGGLMHIAEAYNLPGVCLFAKFNPAYRLSYHSKITPIFTPENVNSILASQVVEVIMVSMLARMKF